MKINAFTLSEVLISLLIIGVIAAIVIPTVVNSTNEAEYNILLKKSFSDLSNALLLVQVNNGGIVNVGTADDANAQIALRNDFCNVMQCIKIDTFEQIFGTVSYKLYKSTSVAWPGSSTHPAATLPNGNIVRFVTYNSCNNYSIHACGHFYIDVNGKRAPNMYGKDLFLFYITYNSANQSYNLLPSGTEEGNTCVVGSTESGTSNGCTAIRLTDPEKLPK